MNALATRLAAMIRRDGPLGIADYMRLCLFDPTDGYYTTRDPFGAAGDFITAPEISQMFGEIVALWLVAAWDQSGRPERPVIAEIGPGRATLMRDMVRTVARAAPDLHADAAWMMIEASPRLAAIQHRALGAGADRLAWVDSPVSLPPAPVFIVGNELFDAVPARQFLMTASGWRERLVVLDARGDLAFGLAGAEPEVALPDAPAGAIVEVAPEREALMAELAARIARHGGAGLFFDYGAIDGGFGDTLQAVRAHAAEGVFDHPGEADLTTHVDFSALARVARDSGLDAIAVTQGDFLAALGLFERAARLAAGKPAAVAARIAGEAERLAAPARMGSLFKALAIAPPGLALYPLADRS